jgi:hypothetical protein
MWNLEEELVLKVWNLEKNWFLMWNLEITTSENEWINAGRNYQVASGHKHYYGTTQVDVIHN